MRDKPLIPLRPTGSLIPVVSTSGIYATKALTAFAPTTTAIAAIDELTSGALWDATLNLDLKLRTSAGTAFQDFFSSVLEKSLGEDFVRIRPYGSLGDRGCDGYRPSTGCVYQSYGAVNGATNAVTTLVRKIEDDFAKAYGDPELGPLMKEWRFAHNLSAGTPIEASLAIEALAAKHPKIKFGLIGPAAIMDASFQLPLAKLEQIIGPTQEPFHVSVEITELRKLVVALARDADSAVVASLDLRPVPVKKLEYNKLPRRWKITIEIGWQDTHVVDEYINGHPDPTVGDRIAAFFRTRYQDLKLQELDPGAIMDHLLLVIVGYGTSTHSRMIAAYALLAFLFENCEIFDRGE